MFEQTISKQVAKNLELLGKLGILNNAYLAGGTALALQIGHRISYDLDFFTEKEFKAQIFLKKLSQIDIASITDISAMKVAAISERGTKRDFIDLYFILQEIQLSDVLDFYEQKYKKLASNLIHIKKSLVYFEDAEDEDVPDMLKQVSWREVKEFFEQKIKKLSHSF